MNDLSHNVYLKNLSVGANDMSLRSFLFSGRFVAEKTTGREKLSFTIKDMLSTLGFSVHREGYKYIAELVEYYLVKCDYTEEVYIAHIADTYGLTPNRVKSAIAYCLLHNSVFVTRASRLLDSYLSADVAASVSGAVEICGAIYVLYYNFVVKDGDETERHQFNFKRDILNGFFRKTDKSLNDR